MEKKDKRKLAIGESKLLRTTRGASRRVSGTDFIYSISAYILVKSAISRNRIVEGYLRRRLASAYGFFIYGNGHKK